MENEQGRMPLLGEKFPELEVKTTQGMMKLPDDFKGKWMVFFSHPGDFTPVCTTEFVAFQKRYDQFKELNAELIGLSVDQVPAHIKWIQWIKENLGVEIQFPIIGDELARVAKTLGIIHPAKGTNTVRAVFIVDPQGIIRAILYYPQEIGRNMDEILRMLKAFQTADANHVSIPADWPNNEIMGDEVILPLPQDIKSAEERMNQPNCYDWWLCHKKL
nr:peroxiredoxin [Coprothermobacter platensis]